MKASILLVYSCAVGLAGVRNTPNGIKEISPVCMNVGDRNLVKTLYG